MLQSIIEQRRGRRMVQADASGAQLPHVCQIPQKLRTLSKKNATAVGCKRSVHQTFQIPLVPADSEKFAGDGDPLLDGMCAVIGQARAILLAANRRRKRFSYDAGTGHNSSNNL